MTTRPTYYSLDAAADYLNVSVRTVRRQIATGKLHAVRFGGTIRIHRDQLDAALEPITYLYA